MRRTLTGLAVVALLAGLWWTTARPGEAPSGEASTIAVPADTTPLRVTGVTDGDTFRAGDVRVRLIGIDTPEVHPVLDCWGEEATRALEELVPVGSTVRVAPQEEPEDRFGRRLLDVWTEDGRHVPLALVAAGHAEAIRVWPNVEHLDALRAAEDRAREAGLGLWGACG